MGEFFDLERIAGTEEPDLSKFFQCFAFHLLKLKTEVMFIDKMKTKAANLKDSLEAQAWKGVRR